MRYILVALVVFSVRSGVAAAQNSGGSLGIAYGVIGERAPATSVTPPIAYNPGLFVSLAGRPPRGHVGAVVEFGWADGAAQHALESRQQGGRERRLSWLAGIRVSGRRRTTVFAQVLGGFARESFRSPVMSGAWEPVQPSGLAIQPGAGVDLALSSRSGLRMQGDVILAPRASEDGGGVRTLFRLTAGWLLWLP